MKTPKEITVAGDPSVIPDSPELSAEELDSISGGGWSGHWSWNSSTSSWTWTWVWGS
jgi:hypothetical protein